MHSPNVIKLKEIFNSESLTSVMFSWNPPIANCSVLTYRLTTMNCGNCTDGKEVEQTNVTCTNFTNFFDAGRECSFAIKSIICGNIVEDASNTILVKIFVPEGTV